MTKYEIKVQDHDSVVIEAKNILELVNKLYAWMNDNCAYVDELLSIETIPPPTSRKKLQISFLNEKKIWWVKEEVIDWELLGKCLSELE